MILIYRIFTIMLIPFLIMLREGMEGRADCRHHRQLSAPVRSAALDACRVAGRCAGLPASLGVGLPWK
jgi:hypothetical protein